MRVGRRFEKTKDGTNDAGIDNDYPDADAPGLNDDDHDENGDD